MSSAQNLAEDYHRNGFCVVDEMLTAEEVTQLCLRTTEITNGRVPFPKTSIELEPNAEGMDSSNVRKINACAEHDSFFMKYAKLDRILDVAELLLGPHIKLFGSQAFMKPPGGIDKPYHQDSPYFTIEPMALVTCWIALDNSTLENGCLRIIPGSHRFGPLPHDEPWHVGDRMDMRIPESRFDNTHETPIVLQAGGCSFHHSLSLHSSRPNLTNTPRRGLAFHYMSGESRWTDTTKKKPHFPLLRGLEFEGCV